MKLKAHWIVPVLIGMVGVSSWMFPLSVPIISDADIEVDRLRPGVIESSGPVAVKTYEQDGRLLFSSAKTVESESEIMSAEPVLMSSEDLSWVLVGIVQNNGRYEALFENRMSKDRKSVKVGMELDEWIVNRITSSTVSLSDNSGEVLFKLFEANSVQ